MNKTFGPAADFALVKADGTRTIVSYDYAAVENSDNATWRELYFPKKQTAKPSLDQVKDAIIADINARTDEKIVSGFVWTPEGGDPINVWLSTENQRNFSEAQRMAEKYGDAVLPLRFKLGEGADGTPVYHTFETSAELDAFYQAAFAFVNQCLNEGWADKDNIDWAPYEQALNPEKPKKTTKKK